MRAGILVLVLVACGTPARKGTVREVDAVDPHAEPGPEAKAAADAIVHAYELVTSESAMPGDPAKVRTAAIAALAWKQPVAWTGDAAKDAALLRGVVRSLALRGQLAPDAVLRTARAMTLAAGDIHTFAMPRTAVQAMFALIDGTAVVQPGLMAHKQGDGRWAASELYPGGPAQVAGVLRGDELVSIDGTPIDHGYIDLAYLLGVEPGTEARLAVRHQGIERTLVMRMAPVAAPPVESRMLTDGIGYVRVWSCTRDAAGQLARVLADFEHKKVRRVILDLRGNAGGFPFDLASVLVDADPLMYGGDQPVARTKVVAWKGHVPVAVLVDDSTASGAEMIALALREHAGAILVGRPTAGGLTFPTTERLALAGDVTISYPLSRVGSARTKAPLDGNRLVPDIAAPNRTAEDYAEDRDPQLDAAVAALRRGPT